MKFKKGDKVRIVTTSEYERVLLTGVPCFHLPFEKLKTYLCKQALVMDGIESKDLGLSAYKLSIDKNKFNWPEYMLIRLSDKMPPRISGAFREPITSGQVNVPAINSPSGGYYKDKQYYYARLRSAYAVYQYHDNGGGHSSGDKVYDNLSVVEAKRRVEELNNKQFKK